MGAMASQITSLTMVYTTSNLLVTGLCPGKSPVTGEFPAQMASNAENVAIHGVIMSINITFCIA